MPPPPPPDEEQALRLPPASTLPRTQMRINTTSGGDARRRRRRAGGKIRIANNGTVAVQPNPTGCVADELVWLVVICKVTEPVAPAATLSLAGLKAQAA